MKKNDKNSTNQQNKNEESKGELSSAEKDEENYQKIIKTFENSIPIIRKVIKKNIFDALTDKNVSRPCKITFLHYFRWENVTIIRSDQWNREMYIINWYVGLYKALYNSEDKGVKYTNKAKSIVFNLKVFHSFWIINNSLDVR